ncbi:AbrB/MazE/SpoVT family DNA-binding domain-containing protein [Patescibacteria group bacterium]|nr:AbrB/MazE/SpoVT family DNA-binding domain-containing protein [Patescibacteria group bacterium]MBU1703129.1 AbrB/MazE/SpoVT family DNA-binding domain-containing protein [Patescibacteria group bacterium]MBU1954301.1 AbrB/MazE/SpoVT family DNA-binding domain-containing protein [Patescibacteria group bacterium]
MKISATQWGNSPAVRIPKPFADQIGITNGTMVEIILKNEKIVLPDTMKTQGAVLSDHVKNMDWRSRNAKFLERLPKGRECFWVRGFCAAGV